MAKVLTIREPHATLFLTRFKRIETRSWRTPYRGELYIHSSKIIPKYDKVNMDVWNDCLRLYRRHSEETGKPIMIHPGLIIAKAVLVDCVQMTEQNIKELEERNPLEIDAGFYRPGRYMWIMKDVEPLPEPIGNVRGHLGIWEWKGDTK